MATTPLHRPDPPPLPATLEAWDAQRKAQPPRTINDMVDDIHRRMLADPERAAAYTRFLAAIYDEQAVKRKLEIDDTMAAQMLRTKAAEDEQYHELARESLGAIVKALHVVLRRFGETRMERARRVSGVRVPDENPPPREERSYDAAE
jgi:hypothetical protein